MRAKAELSGRSYGGLEKKAGKVSVVVEDDPAKLAPGERKGVSTKRGRERVRTRARSTPTRNHGFSIGDWIVSFRI